MPGRSRRSSVAGVVVREATPCDDARPAWGWHAFGARAHACSVVCAASSGRSEGRGIRCACLLRQRQTATLGTTSGVDRTRLAVASADVIAFSRRERDEQWLIRRHVVIGRPGTRRLPDAVGRSPPPARARPPGRLLGKRLDGGGRSQLPISTA